MASIDTYVTELIELATIYNNLAKCFSENPNHMPRCQEGLEIAAKKIYGDISIDRDLVAKLHPIGIPLYESAYMGGDPIVLKATLGSLYRAFGVREVGEMSDHLSVELEFLSLILAKIAYAYIKGDRELAREAIKALNIIYREHVLPWISRLEEAIKNRDNRSMKTIIEILERVLKEIDRYSSILASDNQYKHQP
ncbi:MAG: molecular chaperone TorD family protein [Sulfolobales archaeon]